MDCKLFNKRNSFKVTIIFKSDLRVSKDLVFFVSAKRAARQAGSLAGFGFSVGFERPDNVLDCVFGFM
jgi:hypothetical protein